MKLLVGIVIFFLAGDVWAGSGFFRLRRADDSCVDKCDTVGTNPDLPCQCNAACVDYQDCCSDYEEACLSCQDRCGINYNQDFPCQCNTECDNYGNCCSDYSDVCDGGGGVTDSELADLSEQLFSQDVNAVGNHITINIQNNDMGGSDEATEPLFTNVDPAAFEGPTMVPFLALFDNFDPDTSVNEVRNTEEEEAFLDAIMATDIMLTLHQFLAGKGLANSDISVFTQDLSDTWMKLYSRYGSSLGSSGLEHVFLGEMDEGSVSGFHGWEHFYQEEQAGDVNYYGYGGFTDLGQGVSVLEHNFSWQGVHKSVTSMFIGTSPELELALYHLCFLSRPDSLCPIQLAGNTINIQTWTEDCGDGVSCVGSAYPDLSS